MISKNYSSLLLFALIGMALWLSGNLYEGVVIAPNLLKDPISKIAHWQAFFTATNPIYFYLPLVPLAVVCMFVLYFRTSNERAFLKRQLGYAIISLVLAIALSIYIITQINLKLFFGDVAEISSGIYRLALLWNILNVVRIIFLVIAITRLFNAYIFIKRAN